MQSVCGARNSKASPFHSKNHSTSPEYGGTPCTKAAASNRKHREQRSKAAAAATASVPPAEAPEEEAKVEEKALIGEPGVA